VSADTLGRRSDSTITSDSGTYRIRAAQLPTLLTVSAPGYATERTIVNPPATTCNVILRTVSEALATIRVTASRSTRAQSPDILAGGIAAIDNASSGAASESCFGLVCG
jgi:hypothetical protein